MSDSDYSQEFESSSSNFFAVVLIFMALCLHLATVYGGFKFIHWQFDESTADRPDSCHYSLISCWDNNQEEGETDQPEPKRLSHRGAAGVTTLTLWLLMFGWVSHCWPWAFFPIIVIASFMILSKFYLKGGELPEKQRYVAYLGYLTCCTAFATTAAYFLQLCHVRYPMSSYGGPHAGYAAFKVSVLGTLVTLIFGTATALAYRHSRQQQRESDDVTVVSEVESTFKAMP